MQSFLLSFFLLTSSTQSQQSPSSSNSKPVSTTDSTRRESQEITIEASQDTSELRIAFGSCYGIFSHESDIFNTIAADRPDLFIWLGDVAYVDNPKHFGPMPIEYIKERFEMTKTAPGYRELLD